MNQIWNRYETWEDFKAGMWRKVSSAEERRLIPLAAEFTGDHVAYGQAMLRAVTEWPISAEQNLTDPNINQLAWVGHAGCAIEHGWPEYVVRAAWGRLSKEQQDLANEAARQAIRFWASNYTPNHEHDAQMQFRFQAEDQALGKAMGATMLP